MKYKIHPAIGIARVGTSNEFFIGPEVPGAPAAPPDGRYRDAPDTSGKLRRQAARFWIFAYDEANPDDAPRAIEAGKDGIARIEWTVHLANKKAAWYEFDGLTGEGGYAPGHPLRNQHISNPDDRRQKLIIDPGPRSLSDRNLTVEIQKGNSHQFQETWPGPLDGGREITSLGTMATDDQGRLIVAGGYGVSGTVAPPPMLFHFANNDDWFDDVSDGPVTARIIFDDDNKEPESATPAWLIVGPPDFAPPIRSIVTMYDLLYNMAVQEFNANPKLFDKATGGFRDDYEPSFTAEVYPILQSANDFQWVIASAAGHHKWDYTALAQKPFQTGAGLSPGFIFSKIRHPDHWKQSHEDGLMPRLLGDKDFGTALTLTPAQYHVLRQWSQGTFIADWSGKPTLPPVDAETPTRTPGDLDRAALEACVGGAFYPGIEAGWNMRNPQIFAEAFRLRLAQDETDFTGVMAGDITKRSALPWQADFIKCANDWWPAQRPNQVRTSAASTVRVEWDDDVFSHVMMRDLWDDLGIVVPAPPGSRALFYEDERQLPR